MMIRRSVFIAVCNPVMPVSNGLSRFLDNMIQTRCDVRNGFFERFNLKQPAKNMTVPTEKRVDAVFLSAFFVSFFEFLEFFVKVHGGDKTYDRRISGNMDRLEKLSKKERNPAVWIWTSCYREQTLPFDQTYSAKERLFLF